MIPQKGGISEREKVEESVYSGEIRINGGTHKAIGSGVEYG